MIHILHGFDNQAVYYIVQMLFRLKFHPPLFINVKFVRGASSS